MIVANYAHYKSTTRVVIVDADVSGDNRVQLSIREAIGSVVLIDIRSRGSISNRLSAIIKASLLVIVSLKQPVNRYELLKKKLAGRVDWRFEKGMMACLRLLIRSVLASNLIRRIAFESAPNTILHAHDLYCGVAAALAKSNSPISFIYDAHELEIHRNRKTGWLRVLVEHSLEQFVLSRCTELRVVNAAIQKTMEEWYKMPETVQTVYNDFYSHHDITVPSKDKQPSIVFVGQGVNGRSLESLDEASTTNLFQINVFLLGSRLPKTIKGVGWKHGSNDYEAPLLVLSRERRCMMWCCLENMCLSYELATPNKFFQAIAVGIPIIASSGTYLSDIVLAHGIGTIFNGKNLAEIQKAVFSAEYEFWIDNVRTFRKRFRAGKVLI